MTKPSLHLSGQREEGRPDPEELLRRYNLRDSDLGAPPPASPVSGEQIAQPSGRPQPQRGRLRIYLASAAGAGKTYAMLNEGRRRKSRGTDVVVGYVETHGRSLTQAQIGDLEVIPRKKVAYRSVTLEEMDPEAIIARHPRVVLIDELAHTNVPGSKHPKRYQDVQEILDAGIDVVTTMNIQHLESLNDVVASITGVHVHETLPDYILDQAEEVELVDISPHALRQRMRHGNIYPPERIEQALHHFFREGNLTALRELALRRVAEKTEEQLEQYMHEHQIARVWPASERVLVGFDARPHTPQVIREAWRLAHGLHADLLAVSIQLEGYHAWTRGLMTFLRYGFDAFRQREIASRRLEEYALLAQDLGAEVIRTRSHDIAKTLVEMAKEHQITQIVLGQPARSCCGEMIDGSIIERLLRLSKEINIYLVAQSEGE